MSGIESFSNGSVNKEQTPRTLADIEKELLPEPLPEEVMLFEKWKEHVSCLKESFPLNVNSISECLEVLPPIGKVTQEKVHLFFETGNRALIENLHMILHQAAANSTGYEISVSRLNERVFSIDIGDAVRNNSTFVEYEQIGHLHPMVFQRVLEQSEELPQAFWMGLLPSHGDVVGYFKHPEMAKKGTKIVSEYGEVAIKILEWPENFDEKIQNYKEKYFKLFTNKNDFNWKSLEDTAVYFKEEFGMELIFHLNEDKNLEK